MLSQNKMERDIHHRPLVFKHTHTQTHIFSRKTKQGTSNLYRWSWRVCASVTSACTVLWSRGGRNSLGFSLLSGTTSYLDIQGPLNITMFCFHHEMKNTTDHWESVIRSYTRLCVKKSYESYAGRKLICRTEKQNNKWKPSFWLWMMSWISF